jgi:DNA invertase Pin-like site-specific DNA recombinase
MNEKIQPTHLEREAYVYVRQSSMTQVRSHLESQDRQYGLAERARVLGFASVQVIDEDLGRSGTGSAERPGFGKLLAAVCAGTVGAVLALDASRLARNNRDWHHLIDLCAMTRTLVIDYDGTYDPTQLNDRLVLGLKGTMSEFEMSLLRQRALESLRHKVRRGHVLTQVPVGFVRTEDDRMELTPDLQVQEAIRTVFVKFRELGTVRQVLLWYHTEKVTVPTFDSGPDPKAVWRLPVYARLHTILTNPVYCGVFVYGRRATRTHVVEGRAKKTQRLLKSPEECDVFIPNHHEGYISWAEFQENQARIRDNAAMQGRMESSGMGAAKSAKPSLLVFCVAASAGAA